MDERLYQEMMERVVPYLTPAEQSVYQRLFYLSHGQETEHVAIRYEDLARVCNLSLSVVQRAIKTLKAKKLVKTTWQQKSPMTFFVSVLSLAPRSARKLVFQHSIYDQFSPEDRDLFLTCKRSINPKRMRELEDEAREWLSERGMEGALLTDKLDELIMRQHFGPERVKKYEALFLHLYQSK